MKQIMEVLEADRGCRRQRRCQVERGDPPEVRGPVVDLKRIRRATAQRRVRVERDRDRARGEALLVVPVREVDTDGGVCLEEGKRPVVGLRASGELVDQWDIAYLESLPCRRKAEACAYGST